MPLQYSPRTGTIVICDFNTGFQPPEMVKRRPAVIVSRKSMGKSGLVTVVPLSTTPPNPVKLFHHKLILSNPLPHPYSAPLMWAKCDIINTVSLNRLWLPCDRKDSSGKRQYVTRMVNSADLNAIHQCILVAIGINTS